MKKLLASTLLAITLSATLSATEIGILDFRTCATDSKLGKQEQASMETIQKQMMSLYEDTAKKLQEKQAKKEDKDFMDGLSPEAEADLNLEISKLEGELGEYAQRGRMIEEQARYRMIQNVYAQVQSAAEKVATEKNLDVILNKDAAFYAKPALEVTAQVLTVMDALFDSAQTEAQKAAPAAPAPAEAPATPAS